MKHRRIKLATNNLPLQINYRQVDRLQTNRKTTDRQVDRLQTDRKTTDRQVDTRQTGRYIDYSLVPRLGTRLDRLQTDKDKQTRTNRQTGTCLPIGLVSKKSIGARRTAANILLCRTLEAFTQRK